MAFSDVLVFHRYIHPETADGEGGMHVMALPIETTQDKLDTVSYFENFPERFHPFLRSQPIVETMPRLVDGEFEEEPAVVFTTAARRSQVKDPSLITDSRINELGPDAFVVCSMTFPLGSKDKRLKFFDFLENELCTSDNLFRAACTQVYKSRMPRTVEEQPRKRPMTALHIMADALFERKEELTDDEFLDASNRLKRAFDEL